MLKRISQYLMGFQWVRGAWYNCERLPPFLRATFSKKGLLSRDGRTLILGKFRRVMISFCPPFARFLQRHYKMSGGCKSCGASCKLLFQCPHWDEKSHLCSVYEDRPNICRLFPITPADIKDRDIVLKTTGCGFHFGEEKKKPVPIETKAGIPQPEEPSKKSKKIKNAE